MSNERTKQEARNFAEKIKAMGFTVYLAEKQTYGFITDESERRVMSFEFDLVGKLTGNYGPPTHGSGTGWQLWCDPCDLKTAEEVKNALYSIAPSGDWKYYTDVAKYLKCYGESSRFVRI